MKLGLGTVQFGLDYGISNNNGIPDRGEVKKILDAAAANSINIIDTARSYGESETVLGRALAADHAFKIVTKTPSFDKAIITDEDIKELEASFFVSLANLKSNRLYSLLIHNANDLMVQNGVYLYEKMIEFKEYSFVEKIGASVYSGKQIDQLLSRYDLDIIQLPINILDQRLIKSGHLQMLKQAGVEIHARSIFLQGLLLMEPNDLPPYFSPILSTLKRFHTFLEDHSLTALQAALNFVLAIDNIDVAICGVTSEQQLREIIHGSETFSMISGLKQFAIHDPAMLDPSKWRF